MLIFLLKNLKIFSNLYFTLLLIHIILEEITLSVFQWVTLSQSLPIFLLSYPIATMHTVSILSFSSLSNSRFYTQKFGIIKDFQTYTTNIFSEGHIFKTLNQTKIKILISCHFHKYQYCLFPASWMYSRCFVSNKPTKCFSGNQQDQKLKGMVWDF